VASRQAGDDYCARFGAAAVLLVLTGEEMYLAKGNQAPPAFVPKNSGNRYLRILFVQAAWGVLVGPKSQERHGLKPWLEAAIPDGMANYIGRNQD
jgi:hypothetical protein